MIHRIQKTANFAQIANDALRDTRLSYCARGILAMVMSHADGWKTSTNWLRSQTPSEGQICIGRALEELKVCGYLKITRVHGEGGKMTGAQWSWSDKPQPADPSDESPSSDFPYDGQPYTQNTILSEHQGEEHQEASPKLVKAPLETKSPKGNPPSSPPQECPPPPPAPLTQKPRPRNLLGEAALSACRIDPATATKTQWGAAVAAVKQIKDAYPAVTPQDLLDLGDELRKRWGKDVASFTPMTLSKHWRPPAASGSSLPESTLTEVEAKIRACRGFHHHIDHEKATEEEHAEYARLLAKRRTMV